MPREPIQPTPADPLVSRPRLAPRPFVAAAAVAAVLGAGLGLWARPGELDRGASALAAKRAAEALAPRRIAIVVAGRPAAQAPQPAAAPMVAAPPAADPPEPRAPRPSDAALVRVKAVVPSSLTARSPAAPPAPARARERARSGTATPPRPRPKPARTHEVARPRPEPAGARPAAARPSKPKAVAERPAARPARPVRVAAAKAPAPKAPAPKAPAPKAPAPKAPAPKALGSRAVPRKVAHLPSEPPRAKPRGAGPERVAHAARCVSPDPGAALVCADPALGAADRQLARTYRRAEEAGVPGWRLQRQQQRWLAARASAARDAPWAVHDVYLARIAELQDEIRRVQTSE